MLHEKKKKKKEMAMFGRFLSLSTLNTFYVEIVAQMCVFNDCTETNCPRSNFFIFPGYPYGPRECNYTISLGRPHVHVRYYLTCKLRIFLHYYYYYYFVVWVKRGEATIQ